MWRRPADSDESMDDRPVRLQPHNVALLHYRVRPAIPGPSSLSLSLALSLSLSLSLSTLHTFSRRAHNLRWPRNAADMDSHGARLLAEEVGGGASRLLTKVAWA